jgi:hypothetical protein
MPGRRHEKRPPFKEKGGVLLEAETETVGLEGVRRPLQTVPVSSFCELKETHPGWPGESKRSNGLPLTGIGRGAQGLTGFGSWGTGRKAKGSGTYGM